MTHRMKWFVWVGGKKIRREATMRGQWGYDVECSCGNLVTNTGGATRRYINELIFAHKLEENTL